MDRKIFVILCLTGAKILKFCIFGRYI